jgi:hypothetical protein
MEVTLPHSFATTAVQPSSPNKPKLPPTKSAIATASLELTSAVRKHQDNFLSLLCSSTGTAAILDCKTGQLRIGNIALMSSATIGVQQAGGIRFLLERLYRIARSEEKEACQLFTKEALMTATTDTATAMSSIMDTDGFTTVSCCGGGSSSSPPKQRPQSCSLPRPSGDIKQINPFNDKFLTSAGGHVTGSALPVDMRKLSNPDSRSTKMIGGFDGFGSSWWVTHCGHWARWAR